MKASDKYFQNIQKMAEFKKTNITKKEVEKYYQYGEESLKYLKDAIKEMMSWGDGEIAPSIPPRDDLPDMYMRFGRWDDAERVMEECYKNIAISKKELDENIKWIKNNFKYIESITTGSFINFPFKDLKDYEEEYYGENKERLREIRKKFDENKFFFFEQIIK